LVTGAILLVLIVVAPVIEYVLVLRLRPGETCSGGVGVVPVPASFVVDAILLVPATIACVRGMSWLRSISAGAQGWRKVRLRESRGLAHVTLVLAFLWTLFWGFGIPLGCLISTLNG
jgi:hypothetical protein